ncbi:MAG TPA: hypothetical protein VMM84_12075 [Pyrinomonadaceae bacterium]|nr:hypothetical protein [Pyrinomonadaceae bacterium]
MALPWDYETWPKPDESAEELKRARLQDEEFDDFIKQNSLHLFEGREELY